MPLGEVKKNFVFVRIRDPRKYSSFRIKKLKHGVLAVIGRLGPGKSEIQALRVPVSLVGRSVQKARAWAKKHGFLS